jgi:hypothetical protein
MKGLCQFLLFLLQSKFDIKLKQREIIKLQFMWFCSSLGKVERLEFGKQKIKDQYRVS